MKIWSRYIGTIDLNIWKEVMVGYKNFRMMNVEKRAELSEEEII